jgi:hypothetical protein
VISLVRRAAPSGESVVNVGHVSSETLTFTLSTITP